MHPSSRDGISNQLFVTGVPLPAAPINPNGQIAWIVLGIVVLVHLESTGERPDRDTCREGSICEVSGNDREMHGNGLEPAPRLPIAGLSGTPLSRAELLLHMEVQLTSDGITRLHRLPIPQPADCALLYLLLVMKHLLGVQAK